MGGRSDCVGRREFRQISWEATTDIGFQCKFAIGYGGGEFGLSGEGGELTDLTESSISLEHQWEINVGSSGWSIGFSEEYFGFSGEYFGFSGEGENPTDLVESTKSL